MLGEGRHEALHQPTFAGRGSVPTESERTLTPRSRGCFTVVIMSIIDRPMRSIRHTTSSSPSRSLASSANQPSLIAVVLVPDIWSEWIW